jgi:hypothetical protein
MSHYEWLQQLKVGDPVQVSNHFGDGGLDHVEKVTKRTIVAGGRKYNRGNGFMVSRYYIVPSISQPKETPC